MLTVKAKVNGNRVSCEYNDLINVIKQGYFKHMNDLEINYSNGKIKHKLEVIFKLKSKQIPQNPCHQTRNQISGDSGIGRSKFSLLED